MKTLLTEKELQKTIDRMASAMLKQHHPFSEIILVGIQTRGVSLAQRLRDRLQKKVKGEIPLGILDINLYRDDLSTIGEAPLLKKTEIPNPIQGKGIILVDDVLYTGRTIRAAMDALMDLGRPRFIELAALIDRGGRELPIGANYVGKTYKAKAGENVKVMFQETDGTEKVMVK
jgi:pyrimidine operon attenuation protein / uracil phosphoribosyltransferase